MARKQNNRRADKKKRELLRRKMERLKTPSNRLKEPSAKVSRKLQDAYELIEGGVFDEAEWLIGKLVKQHSQVPAVIEAQLHLYQATRDSEKTCLAAKQLLKLTPKDPDAVIMYAQSSLFCGRASIALREYRKFLARWPDHENSSKAQVAIEVCEPECRSRLERAHKSGFTDLTLENGGLELFATHEESLEQLRAGNFEAAIELCQRVLKTEPRFLSARNNLATCCFQNGDLENATITARETCRLNPANRYAEANLAKLEMLTGNEAQANAIADRIVSNPPTEQDSIVAAIEAMSYLGRDQDVVLLGTGIEQNPQFDAEVRAMGLHHMAVAAFRMGDRQKADGLWKRSLHFLPSHHQARDNLDDIHSGIGHAAWADPISKWIPHPLLERMKEKYEFQPSGDENDFSPGKVIQSLVPALLDRGDAVGRELALTFAKFGTSPPMFDALKTFAFGQRGPDSLRNDALAFLHREGFIDSGSHRFYCRGKWTNIKLFCPEITFEPTRKCEPWKAELTQAGLDARARGDDKQAEKIWLQILEREPDDLSATLNLAVVWLNRNDRTANANAIAKLEELHEKNPDYILAPIVLANMATRSGDLERARKLLGGAMQQKKLHASEAAALFSTQVEFALAQRHPESAEMSYQMLVNVVGEDDPAAIHARNQIDSFGSMTKY